MLIVISRLNGRRVDGARDFRFCFACDGSCGVTDPGPNAWGLTPDQKGYIAYDQCMMHAAIRASHTDAKDEEIFELAEAQCAPIRAKVVIGQEGNRQYLSALDAADADKAANFPGWIKGVRERRRSRDQSTAPAGAPRK